MSFYPQRTVFHPTPGITLVYNALCHLQICSIKVAWKYLKRENNSIQQHSIKIHENGETAFCCGIYNVMVYKFDLDLMCPTALTDDRNPLDIWQWASYQMRKIAGCACAGNAGNVTVPRHWFQGKPLVSYPGMHHGTCTHVPWCMSGSLTRGGGENVPGILGAWATRKLHIWQEAHDDTNSPQRIVYGLIYTIERIIPVYNIVMSSQSLHSPALRCTCIELLLNLHNDQQSSSANSFVTVGPISTKFRWD